jgi:hypothetical protein
MRVSRHAGDATSNSARLQQILGICTVPGQDVGEPEQALRAAGDDSLELDLCTRR